MTWQYSGWNTADEGWRSGGDSGPAAHVTSLAVLADGRLVVGDGARGLESTGWAVGATDELSVTYAGATDATAIALSTNLGSQALVVTEDNVIRTTPMIELTRQANATGDALAIDGSGSGNLVYLRSNAAQAQEGGSGLDVLLAGTARTSAGISVWESGTPVRSAALCDLSRSNAFATGAALNIAYAAVNDAITVALSIGLSSQALVVTEDNVIRTTPMIELTRQANATGTGITINNSGSGLGISITSVGSGSSYFAAAAGAGSAYYASLSTALNQSAFTVIEDNVVRTAPMIRLTRAALATGPMIDLTPGAATEAVIRARGGKIDLSIAGDNGENIFSPSDNNIYVTAGNNIVWRFSSTFVQIYDGQMLVWGSGSDAASLYSTAQTPDSLVLGVGADSNGFIICEKADIAVDFAKALQANPTVWWQAADATDATKWGSIARDDNDFVIAVGAGGNGDLFLKPGAAGYVKFGTKTGTGDVAIDGYVSVKDAAGNVIKLATVA